jgi:hypothetical protein
MEAALVLVIFVVLIAVNLCRESQSPKLRCPYCRRDTIRGIAVSERIARGGYVGTAGMTHICTSCDRIFSESNALPPAITFPRVTRTTVSQSTASEPPDIQPSDEKKMLRAENARRVGTLLVDTINDTAERTGHSPDYIMKALWNRMEVGWELEGGRLNLTEKQLLEIAPKMPAIVRACEEIRGKKEAGFSAQGN